MERDETPKTVVPTQSDKGETEVAFWHLAEHLLPQLTDAEWDALREKLVQMRRRLRQYEFNQRIGYFV